MAGVPRRDSTYQVFQIPSAPDSALRPGLADVAFKPQQAKVFQKELQ